MKKTLQLQKFAAGDFTEIGDDFLSAGFSVTFPAQGIVQLRAPDQSQQRMRLLISMGIHGDETAPIELMARLLSRLMQTPDALAVDLMLVVGNLAAIRQARRYIDVDLNRLFFDEKEEVVATAEAERASVLMRETEIFFTASGTTESVCWHLDLHTAIRTSFYPTFAIIPSPNQKKDALIKWLSDAGIAAAVLNHASSATYSAYTARRFGASSCTLELGRIGMLGANDLTQFSATEKALDVLLRSGRMQAQVQNAMEIFEVKQEIIKCSENFSFCFDATTKNFTAMQPGTTIASDGDTIYLVGQETEYVLFPNPDVRIGQRAGLMLIRRLAINNEFGK